MSLKQVEEFHKTFNCPVLDKPTIPNKERALLRIALIQEELNELKEGIINNDLPNVAKELTDLQYVIDGTYIEFGLQHVKDRLDDEVHRSNMSKTCDTLAETESTIKTYQKKGVDCYFEERNGKKIVMRAEDKKILKSNFYSAAKTDFVLNEL